MSIAHTYDVIVIGGGPAGMMAAGRARERGLRVLLIEKNPELGRKLSITGGGRCNITNAEFDIHTLLGNYGDAQQFLYAPFAQFGVQDTFDFFTSRKLPLIVEERKRAFPSTEKASDVTRVMEAYVRESDVDVLCSTSVRDIKVVDGSITGVVTDNGVYAADAYVFAVGGKSHPETGSTGDAVPWATKIGHTVQSSNPDLVPLIIEDSWVRKLSGMTLKDVQITFKNKEHTFHIKGNMLCTHFGLSGPAIINGAKNVKEMLKEGGMKTEIDLFPAYDVGSLRKKIHEVFETNANKTFKNALSELCPAQLAESLLQIFPKEIVESKTHSVTRDVRHALVDHMKHLSVTVVGTKGYEWAIVSDGGVELSEIDTKTMQSKICKNLYLVGDTINVNRQSGGFSLQLCWTTGWVAGDNVLK
jgi:predicted Rossmann fold flavoprotein